ncbi:MAG: hypothetical protein AB1938_03635 [Myxococcota bacterium]
MRRAGRVVVLLLAALGGCRTCIDAEAPRNYQCVGDGGADECPGGWRCNTTWGYCFDPDVGAALPCSVDSQCGGGWRCTPAGTCGDPAQEGELSVVEVAGPGTPLNPRLFLPRPAVLRSSESVRVELPNKGIAEHSVAGRAGPGMPVEWLGVHSEELPDGEKVTTSRVVLPAALDDFAVTISFSTGFRHWLWGIEQGAVKRWEYVDGGLVGPVEVLPRPVLPANAWTSITPLRTGGGSGFSFGVVGVATATSFSLRAPPPVPAGVEFTLPYPGKEAAWFSGSGCSVAGAVVLATDAGLAAFGLDGGTPFWSEPAAGATDLRLFLSGPRTFLSWRRPGLKGGKVKGVELTNLCASPDAGPLLELSRDVCPEGDFEAYDMVDLGDPLPGFVTECRLDGGTHVVYAGERTMPEEYLPPRVSSREGTTVFSRFSGGQLTFGPSLVKQEPLTLLRPPEALVPESDGLKAYTPSASFVRTDWGFLLRERQAWEGLPAAWLPEEGWSVTRTGVVVDEAGRAVALPEVEWDNPGTYVLAEVLAQGDGGAVLVATHDDALDVAELGAEEPTLVTRLKPSPATPILSMALQEVTDGGVAEGFVVAGLELFSVQASTERRWTSAPVPLSGLRPVFVWFDRGRPRALLDDGTVLGLRTRVPLSGKLAGEVRAGAALCGAPFALTDSELFRLVESPSGGRSEWEAVGLPLPPGLSRETDFSRGRLMVLGETLFVFASTGAAWTVTPAGGGCP